MLPGTVETGLLESLARTLIDHVSRPYIIEGHRVVIGASVGIAIGDPGKSCADSMIRNADLALYAAKAAGRGKHAFYEASMHSEAADRQLLENDLRQATELARHMAGSWGMSEAIGPMAVLTDADQAIAFPASSQTSADTQRVLDEEVRRILKEARARATALLGEHRLALDALAAALQERETLDEAAVHAVVSDAEPGVAVTMPAARAA